MSDFYSQWLERSKENQKIVDAAPRVARGKDLKWVRTPQDYKAALMIAPETGFPGRTRMSWRTRVRGVGRRGVTGSFSCGSRREK